jgi:ParB/RepB/Spo0J family partition protein
MRVEGQQCPVVLWGKTSPYKVIDGFRRIEAIAGLGRDSVLALVRSDLDQTQALALSFIENARRHNLTPLDKAHAVWQAVHTWEMGKPLVAKTFGLSVRQIERYLKVLDFEGPLHHAVAAHKITMAHAALLNRACVADLPHWIDEVARKRFSARELRRHLTRNGGQPSRRPYLVRDELGFRLRPLRFRIDMSEAEKERIRQALRTALQIVEQRA